MQTSKRDKKRMTILVTDGENRSALAVTRSLGRSGHRIVVTSNIRPSIAAASRYCAASYILSDPQENPDGYCHEMISVITRESADVVIPMTEATIYALNRFRSKISALCLLASPEPEKFNFISNKYGLFQEAWKLGVSIPETLFIQNRKDLKEKIGLIGCYPVVVKPGRSKIRKGDRYISSSVRYARSKDELLRLYATVEALDYPSMIQEKIQGPGTGLFTLFHHDHHLAVFCHQRLKEKPPSGGVSVVCRSVPVDEEMAEASKKLLSLVGWNGVAMVEFKRDNRDGKAKLMEINGRFWGSLQLSIVSGVDFPHLYVDYLFGNIPELTSNDYKKNLQMKWILGTFDHLLICLKNGSHKMDVNGGAASRICALIEFLKIPDRQTTFDVFQLEDLQPFIVELNQYLKCFKKPMW